MFKAFQWLQIKGYIVNITEDGGLEISRDSIANHFPSDTFSDAYEYLIMSVQDIVPNLHVHIGIVNDNNVIMYVTKKN